jgi:hypothetical protein
MDAWLHGVYRFGHCWTPFWPPFPLSQERRTFEKYLTRGVCRMFDLDVDDERDYL